MAFFLNNQPDALIIQILFCYKTLHVSGNLSAHHQEFSTVQSELVSFMQVFDDRFQAESGSNLNKRPTYGNYVENWTAHLSGVQLYSSECRGRCSSGKAST
jgi:mRNA deadenylase 3'-5' endonuclease subunit Ccr4